MKTAVLLIALLGSLSIFSQTTSIRKTYREATKSKEKAKDFYELVKDVSPSDKAVMLAYKGAGKMLLSRYEPISKRKEKVRDAIDWIEKAVKKEPDNVEVRLIRLSVQENLPKFLKYSGNINEDKDFIRKALPDIKDSELIEMINGYFSEFSK